MHSTDKHLLNSLLAYFKMLTYLKSDPYYFVWKLTRPNYFQIMLCRKNVLPVCIYLYKLLYENIIL